MPLRNEFYIKNCRNKNYDFRTIKIIKDRFTAYFIASYIKYLRLTNFMYKIKKICCPTNQKSLSSVKSLSLSSFKRLLHPN